MKSVLKSDVADMVDNLLALVADEHFESFPGYWAHHALWKDSLMKKLEFWRQRCTRMHESAPPDQIPSTP